MNKEQLIEYINLYNQFQNNPYMQFTSTQLNLIEEVHNEAKENSELATLLSNIAIITEQERMNALNVYINQQELKQQGTNVEEVIASTYGIDVSKINHKILDNEKEIFYFYDLKLGRNVVLENKKEGLSLVERLKQMQTEKEKYQLGTDEQNTHQMLEDERNKENVEIKMIPLSELNNHTNELQNLSVEDSKKLEFLVMNADQQKIKYINIENLIGFDEYGNLKEVILNKQENKFVIQDPTGLVYQEEINVSDRVEETFTASEQYNNLQNSYEDIPELQEAKPEEFSEEFKQQIETYRNYPELLEVLPPEQKDVWNNYIRIQEQKEKQEEQRNLQDPPKQKVLKKQDKKAGYADVLLLSLITGFLGGVLTTLTTLLFTK